MTTIVNVRVDSVHGSANRIIYYRCEDDRGNAHQYGPVLSSDPEFDPESLAAVVAERVQASLREAEAEATA